ncbi:MAG: C10 family peptidase [Bacteroidaceae bacterium]|nr:C10 family peptidase [Bacteroidaceae bacterium]
MYTKWLLKLSLAVVVSFNLIACQDASEEAIATPPTRSISNSHTISIDEALENLERFLQDGQTRANASLPKVRDVLSMKLRKGTTRATDLNNVMYIANFSDDKGFAILAADNRVSEKVIAIIDKGNLTQEDIDAAASIFTNKEDYIDQRYPTTGNGLYTIEDYPNELFLNPNTFSAYDETQNDYWIGLFSKKDHEPTTRAIANTEGGIEEFALLRCGDYAWNELARYEDGSNVSVSEYSTTTTYSDWVDVQQTNNILSAYVRWNQRTPFNDLYPVKRNFPQVWEKGKAPAGCFPLSIAKVMTHFRQPKNFSYSNYTVDWDAVNNIYSPLGKQSVAALLKGIAEGCKSMYFYQGTFTFPSKASSFLEKMGYCNVKRLNYRYDRVTSMINNGCPVIIYAIPGWRIGKSHAWIIDGYKTKVRQKITKHFRKGYLTNTVSKPDTCRMVHCDFGWGGLCNGYYVDKVFKLNSDQNEYDNPGGKNKKTNYNRHIRIITYKNPS